MRKTMYDRYGHITLDDIIIALKEECYVRAAAKRLNCSMTYIYSVLAENNLTEEMIVSRAERNAKICEKRQATNFARYGIKEPWNSEKAKQTNLERYGATNPFSSKIVCEKIKQTNLLRYGVENPACSIESRKKASDALKKRTLEKYGVENPWQVEEIKKKIHEKKDKNNSWQKSLQNRNHGGYSKKELSLSAKLKKFGFIHNDFKTCFNFGKTRKYPDYINFEKKLVLEFNGTYWHSNSMMLKYGVVQPDIAELRHWYNNYLQHGYQLVVIQESDYDFFMTHDLTYDEFISLYLWQPEYDFYVAGPFFNDEQNESMSKLENLLLDKGYKLFRPKYDAGKVDMKTAKDIDLTKIFNADVEGICNAKCILANITYKDTGTAFELGYSHGKHIPTLLYNDIAITGKKVNLMLSQTADAVFNSLDELSKWLDDGSVETLDDKLKANKIEVE